MRPWLVMLLAGCSPGVTEPGPLGLESALTCSLAASGESFVHTIFTRTDGTVDVTCLAGDGASSSTGFATYSADQYGAEVGGCQVAHDFDEPSGGWWAFQLDRRALVSEATYWDPGSPLYGMTRELECVEQ